MNPRATAALALVVALVGAAVWWFEVRGADVRAEREEAEKRIFPGFEADEIDWIELETRDGERARLERREGVWHLAAPLDFPADDAAAGGLASSLAGLLEEAAYDDPAPLAEYGLEGEPKVRFGVGEESFALRIGGRSPVGGNTYAATASDAPVYAVASYRVAGFDKALDDLRDKRILRFERDRVMGIRASWPGGAVRLAREPGEEGPGTWRVVEPVEDAADEGTVEGLLSDLEFLRANGFREGGDAEAFSPAFAAELVLDAPEGEERVAVRVGEAVEGDRRDVRGPREGAGYQIAAARLEDFPRSIDAYRDRTLARFVAGDAQRVELLFHAEGSAASHEVTATRGEEGWSSEPERIDPARLDDLLREVAALDADRVAAESAGDEELRGLGLEPPRVALRVRGAPDEEVDAEGAVLAEVHLGVADAERGIAARRPDRETVYWLPFETGENVPLDLEALRSRFLAAEEDAAAEVPAEGEGDAGAPAPDAP